MTDTEPRIDAPAADVMMSVARTVYGITGDVALTLKLTMAIRAGLADDGLVVRDVGTGAAVPTV